MEFDSFVGRLAGLKRNGTSATARCPAHEDRQASLSVSPGREGIVVKCFAGCSAEQIAGALGLTIADLFYAQRNGHHATNGAGLTLEAFAKAKGFEVDFLRNYGVEEQAGKVVFHYHLMNGQKAARQRIRLSLSGDKRFIWNKSEGKPTPYGLQYVSAAHKRGIKDLYLVEGESDALTLWLHGLTAIGVPGADMTKLLQAPHVNGFTQVFIVKENDQGGETFEKGLVGRLAEIEYRGEVRVLEMAQAEVKDINDLHCKALGDPGGWDSEFQYLVTQSRAVDLPLTGLEIFDASTVTERRLEWLWPSRIPLGKLVLFVGAPGLGKSFAALDVAAHLSNGRLWPDGSPNAGKSNAVIFSAEDSLEDTIVPRLRALEAEHGRIMLARRLKEANESGEIIRRAFNLGRDLPHLERTLDRNPDTRLVVVDPVSAYMGRTDSHKNAEVRSDVLDPLAELAERRNVTVLAVTHFNKGSGSNSLERVSGSVAFPAAARVVWGFARDPEDSGKRLMLFGKSNVGPEMPGLAFRIVPYEDGRATIQWVQGEIDQKLDDVLRREQEAVRDRRGGGTLDAAKELIRELCANREILVSELERAASERGISERTLNRARFDMGVKWRREGFGREGRTWVTLLVP